LTTTRKTKSAAKSTSTGTARSRTGLRKAKETENHETETLALEPGTIEVGEIREVEKSEKEAAVRRDDLLPRMERLEKDLREVLNRISLALSDSRVALSKAEQSFDRSDEISGQIGRFNQIIDNLQALHDENVDDLDALESRIEEFNLRFEEIGGRLQGFDQIYEELAASFEEKFRTLKEEDVARMQETLGGIEESRREIQTALDELKQRYDEDKDRLEKAHKDLVDSTLDLSTGVKTEVLDEMAKTSQALKDEIAAVTDSYRKSSTDIVGIQERVLEILARLNSAEERLNEGERAVGSNREEFRKLTEDVKREFIGQLVGTSEQMQRDYGAAMEIFQAETVQVRESLTSLFETGQRKLDENINTLVRDFSTVSDRITELQDAHERKVEEYSRKLKEDLDEFGRHHNERIAAAEKSLVSGIEELKRNYTEKVEETTLRLQEQFSAMEQSLHKLEGQSEALEGLLQELSGKEEEDALRILELQEDKNTIVRSLEELGTQIGKVDDKAESIKARLAEEFEKTQQAWQRVQDALSDAEGALVRTKEAHEKIDELQARIDETRTDLEGLMTQMRENTLLSEANLDKAKVAMRLMEEIEEKSKSIITPLDDIIQSFEDFEKLPESTDLGFELNDLLQVMVKHTASDLHLKVGAPPTVRLDGELIPVGNQILTDRDCRRLILSAMTKGQRRRLMERQEADFIYTMNTMRFRINAFLQKSSISAAFKMLRSDIPTLEELSIPSVVKKLISGESGLIIVTGPAGSGRSTTLAALVDYINTHRKMHIITIEDPIEFVHRDKLSIVTQREIGTDTNSYVEALKQAMRQDPDVVLIGDLRDPETMMAAVMAAETGHLVISTMHLPNAIQAINRLVSLFSPEQQKHFRLLLSNTLRGVISQKLLNLANDEGRVPAIEILVVTPTIAGILLDGKLQDIYPHMVQGTGEGMQTFTSSITKLFESGLITKEEALAHSEQPTDMRVGLTGDGYAMTQQIPQYQSSLPPSTPLQPPPPHIKQVTDAGEDLNLQWL
jgi:twitching motility protein PilT